MKTYLPKLAAILVLICRYILRWNVQIKANLPGPASAAVDAVLEACQLLLVIVEGELPPNTIS